jgi:VWFA-related protein
MKNRLIVMVATLSLAVTAFAQRPAQKPDAEQPIRISAELVQLDVVVSDKNGHVVKGLSKDDFELYETGKKQFISFFESVDALESRHNGPSAGIHERLPEQRPSAQGPGAQDIRRIFAFVIDDLEIRYSDLVYVRQMLTNFANTKMQPGDLVAIVRTLGGKGLLQQFTTDKELLRRAIASLTPVTHALNAFDLKDRGALTDIPNPTGQPSTGIGGSAGGIDISRAESDTNKILRAYMSLGAASFLIDGMRELPGRKSMILISGGLPILSSNRGNSSATVSDFLNSLLDKATRAGVAINTIDIRGLSAHMGVSSFEDTPASSSTGGGGNRGAGRMPDERQFGYKNPFDVMEAHQGLRLLASETGGIAVLDTNNLNEGLDQIIGKTDAYYLLAYTPADSNFKGEFRKVEIRVKNKDLRVYSRSGYFAREEQPAAAPVTKQEQVLAAIKSPYARRDVDLEAMILYKAVQPDKGTIDISILVDPMKLQFEEIDGKQQASYDVVGFVFDELGKLRGGFSETVNASLTPDELRRAAKDGGLPYTTSTILPAGVYQVRLAIRDSKSGAVGTLSRYLEVPDLSKGRLAASSLLLGATGPEMKADNPTPLSASRRISRKQDLRYAVVVYNPKLKGGKPQVQTQLVISQNGQVIYKEAEETITIAGNSSQASKVDVPQAIRIGQLGLARVKPGRYTATLVITDTLADKKAQTITRSMDFEVID